MKSKSISVCSVIKSRSNRKLFISQLIGEDYYVKFSATEHKNKKRHLDIFLCLLFKKTHVYMPKGNQHVQRGSISTDSLEVILFYMLF